MIFAAIDPDTAGSASLLFRGQPPEFWLSRIFRKIRFHPLEKTNMGCGWMVVFDLGKFAGIRPQDVNRFIEFLESQPNRDTIFTLKGYPFFAVSPSLFEKFGLAPGKGVCRQLAEMKPVTTDILGDVPVWNLPVHCLEIETHIVNYQLSMLQANGVRVDDFRNFFIEGQVKIGRECRIGPGVVVRGDSEIGDNVRLFAHAFIENSTIGDGCEVLPHCVLRDSQLEKDVRVGPYTHLRNRAVIRKGAKAGNFVEIKKSVLGKGSKAMHLSYIGDAIVGENVNIGAGTITCNYDGREKHVTRIGDNVFIGSGTELIAPIRVGKNSVVGAGSTLDSDVPDDSLAIARERQVNKPGWIRKGRKKKK